MLNHYLVHMRNAAQRWFRFHNVGQSPHRRSDHAMASDGTRVFVLGGNSPDALGDDIYFFDTSMSVCLVNLSGQRSKLRTQRTSSTRNPMSAKVQRSTMRSPPHLILLLKEKLRVWSSKGSCPYCLLRKLSGTAVLHI
jgi:hypothetical protein